MTASPNASSGNSWSRRRFVHAAGAAVTAAAVPPGAELSARRAYPAVGIQIYQFLDEALRDFDGALRQISNAGFTHVELMAGLAPPAAMALGLRRYGLAAPSVHTSAVRLYPGAPALDGDLDQVIACCRAVGARYLTCSTPWIEGGLPSGMSFDAALDALDGAAWQAHTEFLNRTAVTVRKAGLKLAYHNHRQEFRRAGTTSGFDIIVSGTDEAAVVIELDCGWAAVGGEDPVRLIERHGDRIKLLHLKDVVTAIDGSTRSVPLGQGSIDLAGILAAARRHNVSAAFVEQEPPFAIPPEAAARESLAFLRRLGAVT